MPRDFFPDGEAEQLVWSRNLIGALAPDPQAWGIGVGRLDAYIELRTRYEAAFRAARSANRSRTDTIRKNELKREHERASRELARLLRGRPGLSEVDRRRLGLLVPSDETAAEAAEQPPRVELSTEPGLMLRVRLRASHGELGRMYRGKPVGAVAAQLFYCVSDQVTVGDAGWTFFGQVTQTRVAMHLPAGLPSGAKVWVRACWVRRKGLARGRMSQPQCTRLLDGIGAPSGQLAA